MEGGKRGVGSRGPCWGRAIIITKRSPFERRPKGWARDRTFFERLQEGIAHVSELRVRVFFNSCRSESYRGLTEKTVIRCPAARRRPMRWACPLRSLAEPACARVCKCVAGVGRWVIVMPYAMLSACCCNAAEVHDGRVEGKWTVVCA